MLMRHPIDFLYAFVSLSYEENIYALSRKEIQPLNEATGQFHSDDMLHMLDLFNAQMHFKTEH